MKIFYDGYEIQKYRRLIDFFCQHVAAYNRQRENQMKTANNYHKLLYQKYQKKNRVLSRRLTTDTKSQSCFKILNHVSKRHDHFEK